MNDKDKVAQKKYERALKELFSNSGSCVAIYEAKDNGNDFIFKDFNKTAEKVEKVKKREVLGKSVLEKFPGVKKFGLFEVFQRVWKTGKTEYCPVAFYEDNRIHGWKENYVYKLPSGEIAAVYNDLTRFKQIEEERNLFFNLSPDILCLADFSGRFSQVSPACEKILGWTSKELTEKPFIEFVHPEDKERTLKASEELYKGKTLVRLENRYLCRDGSYKWLSWNCFPLVKEKLIVAIARDITVRQNAEGILRDSEKRYRMLFESAKDGILIINAETRRIMDINPFLVELLGYSKKELLGKTLCETAMCTDTRFCKTLFSRLAAKKYFYHGDLIITAKNGSSIYVDFVSNVYQVDHTEIIQCNIRDVTERRRMEYELRKVSKDWYATFDSTEDLIMLLDADFKVFRANSAVSKFLNKKSDKIIGQNCCRLFHGVDSPIKECPFAVMMQTKKHEETELYIPENDAWFLVSVDPLLDDKGKLTGAVHFMKNITERKRMESNLRESEEKYRTLFETAQDAIILADAETGIILDVNKKAGDLLGMPCKDILGLHQNEIHPKEDEELYRKRFNKRIKDGVNFISVAYVYNRKGFNIPVQINTSFIEMHGKKVVMGIFRDITDIMKTEEMLKKDKINLEKRIEKRTIELRKAMKELEDSKRLSDIGALAATIAHELRNPLGVIKTAVYNIKSKSRDPSLISHLASVDKKILESDQIIKNLLTYSKIKMPQYENIVIHNILDECINAIKEKYAKWDVSITSKSNCAETGTIEADPLQMTELFLNILDNAFQSFMDKKGSIQIAVECDKGKGRFNISIEDNGIGIDKKDLPNIFNQFFTTKARGIGLGLAVCKQVVSLHNGKIKIDSEQGKGTTVYVSLPMKKG